MAPSLFVKNTFICTVDAEALSPICARSRRRALTVSFSCKADADGDEAEVQSACSTQLPPERESTAALAAELEAGGAQAAGACRRIVGLARDLVEEEEGAHLLRRAMALGGRPVALRVAGELTGSVCEAAKSVHACEVLEDLIIILGTADVTFIATELRCGGARTAAMGIYSHTLFCRLLEFSSSHANTAALADDAVTDDVITLCCHKFGYHVAMSLLSNGLDRHRRSVLCALLTDAQRFARHRYASQVVVQAFTQCPADECCVLAFELMKQLRAIPELACHNFGLQVVSAMFDLPWLQKQVHNELSRNSKKLRKDKFGQMALRVVGLSAQPWPLLSGVVAGA